MCSDGETVGRFAPTPSGEMHVGNLLCALIAYLSAKSRGGRFLVRIENLDAARCPQSAEQKILDVLGALGLGGDGIPVRQSERGDVYREKEDVLRKAAKIYPCFCSRAQLHAAEAPRLGDGGIVYGGRCRGLTADEVSALFAVKQPCYRIAVPNKKITFCDGIAGIVTQDLSRECGDFIIRRGDGVYAYQLAVVVDDGESGVSEVVRGNDLLGSTARQIWLAGLLGYRIPDYYHIPLACDPSGRKLSKSEGDSAAEIVAKFPPERILGSLAFAAGILPTDRTATLSELTAAFSWDKVRRDAIRLPAYLLQN